MTIQSNPKVSSYKLPQSTDVSNDPQRVLVIGQMISGTATAGELQTEIGNSKEEDTLFGSRSQISGMIRSYKGINKETRIDAIPLADNGAAVKATAEVEFTGTASEAGSITINVGSRENHSYQLDVQSGDDSIDVGSLLINAITADTEAPFTASTDNTELITNGTFETGITGWNNVTGTIEQSSTYAHSGTYSLRFYGGTAGGGCRTTSLYTTTTGKSYRYNFWIRGTALSVGETIKARVKQGDNAAFIYLVPLITLTNGWVQYSGEYIELGGGSSAYFELEIPSGASITDLYLDDVSIQEASNTVVITAENGGTVANNFSIETKGVVDGITTTLTGWTGGTTDPVLTDIFDVIGTERYQHIFFPSEYGFSFIDDFIAERWNVDNDYLTGFGYTTITDTLANLKSTANTLNNQALVVIGDKVYNETTYKGSAMFEIDYVKTANIVAVNALRLTEGANLTRILSVKDAPLDYIGGVALSSLPIFNTLLSQLPLIDTAKGWTAIEIDELLEVGISTIGNNQARNAVITGQFVTTYKTDVAGNPDESWKFFNHVLTATAAAEYMFNNAKSDFAQTRLTNGVTFSNRAIVDSDAIRARFLQYYDTLSSSDYLLLQAGNEQRKIFNNNLNIIIDLLNGKVTLTDKSNMVSQLRELIILSQFGFTAE